MNAGGQALLMVELAELLRASDEAALDALVVLSGVEPEISATTAIELTATDTADIVTQADRLGDLADQLRTLAERVVPTDTEVRWSVLQEHAAAALAEGVSDERRVLVLARCLSVRTGLRTLAESLRTTDAHLSWTATTIGQVLGAFRSSDDHFVRRLTGRALLSPETLWSACTSEQLASLGEVLDAHAATDRCR